MEVEIGQTYLDIWGYQHTINGYVRKGFKQEDKTKVWSASGHFWKKDGTSVRGGHDLVVMSPKGEVAFWKKRIQLIIDNNSTDKLRMVADLMQKMHERIAELEVVYAG